MSEHDTVFALPSVDDDPDTELGVLLMGFGPERLLAGLGVAGTHDDPVTVTLLVDQLRHGMPDDNAMAEAITAGAARWRLVRPALRAAEPVAGARTAALRKLWSTAMDTVTSAVGSCGRGELVYLTACWTRRDEIDPTADR
jgi:Family of unknown function (DUF6187)